MLFKETRDNIIHFTKQPEIDYNKTIDYHSHLPYSTPYFNSIYEGVTIEINIVDHCNLNCAGCNRLSPLAEEYFISLNYYENQLIELQANIPNVKQIVLMGGEPTLHPNLLELCQITRKYFPSIEFYVVSNGINLSSIISNINYFNCLNMKFLFCSYLKHSNYEQIKSLGDLAAYTTTRLYSTSILIDEKGQENKIDNFFNCYKFTLPNLVLKDYKLYICPLSSCMYKYFNKANINFIEEPDIDSLDIRKIQNNLDTLQTFCFTPKNFCSYCNHKSNLWLYHASERDLMEYNTLLSKMYFSDYDRYESIVLGDKDYFLTALDSTQNPALLDNNYNQPKQHLDELRFGKGKLDIIIAYNDYILPDNLYYLTEMLSNQTIIKDCVLYLVSDHSTRDAEIIQIFDNNPKFNCIFLKCRRHGIIAAKDKGFQNSHNKYTFFLDVNDYFIDSKFLEKLYQMKEGI